MANYHLYVYVYKFDFWALAFVLCTVCSFAPPQPARADLGSNHLVQIVATTSCCNDD
jgi:hypothetical protein